MPEPVMQLNNCKENDWKEIIKDSELLIRKLLRLQLSGRKSLRSSID